MRFISSVIQASSDIFLKLITMTSGLHCSAHPGEHFTNFCTSISCLHPLCPECIDDHVLYHKQSKSHNEIASILNVKKGCE